jgi:hypothetical protein
MPGSRLNAVLRANPAAPTGAVWTLNSATSAKAVKIGLKIYTMDEEVAQAVVGLLKHYEDKINRLREQLVGGPHGNKGPIDVYQQIVEDGIRDVPVGKGRDAYSLRLRYAYRPQTVQGTQPYMVPTVMAKPVNGTRTFPVEFVTFHTHAPRGVMVQLR